MTACILNFATHAPIKQVENGVAYLAHSLHFEVVNVGNYKAFCSLQNNFALGDTSWKYTP